MNHLDLCLEVVSR